MNASKNNVTELIQRVCSGDRDALGELLEQYRPYLRILAQREVDGLGARIDASDLVQQTCLSAVRNVADFDGSDEAQFIAWLRLIHQRNIRDTIRNNIYSKKRAVDREAPMAGDQAVEQNLVSNRQTSPSQRAMRGENAVRLAKSLGKIPEDQREAVRLRYLEGYSVAQIAEAMDRTETAVGGLLKRGLKTLRRYLKE